MLKKRGVIEFSWIFALIVGAIILFLAFYFIGTKFTEKNILKSIQTEQSLDIIFNPFSSFGSLGATSSKVILLRNSEKINFSCDSNGLGFNSILVSTEAVLKPRLVYDKYIFTENFSQGKDFQIISKPFSMPWRVADFIYFIPRNINYCFIGFNDIKDEFGDSGTGLNISNFQFKDSRNQCNEPSIKVCRSGCDINVNNRVVTKTSGTTYYVDDATMYAAIFSDPTIYNCNLKRLGKRIEYQTKVYDEKVASILSRCSDTFGLSSLRTIAGALYSERSSGAIGDRLIALKASSDIINDQNRRAQCKLF